MPSNIQTITFQYQLHNDLQSVPSHWHALIDSAQQITEQAYAPYSRFKVGAAVLLDNGVIVTGNNQENMVFQVSFQSLLPLHFIEERLKKS